MRSERVDESLAACQKALDRACNKVGTGRITHHDLRHLFATRCIESGVDVPTVSRWLGHKDGGTLAMKTYGHLRRAQHLTGAACELRTGCGDPGRRDCIPGDRVTSGATLPRGEEIPFF
jgi:hypothetical protein